MRDGSTSNGSLSSRSERTNTKIVAKGASVGKFVIYDKNDSRLLADLKAKSDPMPLTPATSKPKE